jgi:hypothetical protein
MKEKIMIKFLKSLFGIESPSPVATPAPYKVEATTPAKADYVAPVVAKSAPAKTPAKPKKQQFDKKPAATKAAAIKAPAKPKAPATKKPKISIAK